MDSEMRVVDVLSATGEGHVLGKTCTVDLYGHIHAHLFCEHCSHICGMQAHRQVLEGLSKSR
jgi:hypothetical protein